MCGVTAQTTAEDPETASSTLVRSLIDPTTDLILLSVAWRPE